MRSFVRSGAALLLVGFMAAACAKTQAPAEAPKADPAMLAAAADSMSKGFAAAVAARDTDAVAAMYADDARLMPPNMPMVQGRDAIRGVWAEFLKMPDMQLTPTSSNVIASDAGDLVVDVGSYTFSGKGPKGEAMTDEGKYLTVMKKVDGAWKIVADTWNSDRPIPGM